MKKFFAEFKAFISRGNVFDMAVGLIIASAFNKIVSSLVNDIIMPLITYATGAASLAELSLPLRYEVVDGVKIVTLRWSYGNFIQTVIDFLIIAFSIFIMVKIVNASRKKLQEFNEFVEVQTKKETKIERKELKKKAKAENRPFKVVYAERQEEKKKIAEEKKRLAEEEKARIALEERIKNPTQEDLLKEIRDLLKQDKPKSKK